MTQAPLDFLASSSARPAFVFAHPDDAVLSATIGLLAADGRGLDILVCGGRPPDGAAGEWDREAGFTTSAEAHASRLAEHRTVCEALGLASIVLPQLDGQYDTGGETADSASLDAPLVDKAAARVEQFGAALLISHRRDAQHSDHRKAARLTTRVAQQLGLPILRVCDRPYVGCRPHCSQAHARDTPMTVELRPDEWRRKQQLLEIYHSQHGPLMRAFGSAWKNQAHLGWECFTLDLTVRERPGGGDGPERTG